MKSVHKNYWCKPPFWIYLVTMIIPYAVLVAVAFFWPAQFSPNGFDFTNSPFVRLVPSISAYVDKSQFPHTIAAYFMLSGLMVIPYLVCSLRYPLLFFISKNKAKASYEKYKARRFVYWLIISSFVGFSLWIMYVQPGYQFGAAPIRENRWALAIFGILFNYYFNLYVCIMVIGSGVNFERLYQHERLHYGVE